MPTKIWLYKGPYNRCDDRDIMNDRQRAMHKLAKVDEFWEIVEPEWVESYKESLRGRLARLEDEPMG